MDPTKEEICDLMDKLTLNILLQMENEVKQKLQIEKAMKNGDILLAKTRYNQGQQTVSCLQLPTEDSKEFNALITINEDQSGSQMLSHEEHSIDKSTNHVDPLKWFGILTPQSLTFAAKNYKKAALNVVDCANTHIELNNSIEDLKRLKKLKEDKFEKIQNLH